MSKVSGTRAFSRHTPITKALSVGLETNGEGYIGFIIELPGAFIRGPTEKEALSKTHAEATSYLRWSKNPIELPGETLVVQRHHCSLHVEDADFEILLDADRGTMGQLEFNRLVELAIYSGETFALQYNASELKDWVDTAKNRSTFYGKTPMTIRETFNHVNRTQGYYLSRTGLKSSAEEAGDFLSLRGYCMKQLEELFKKNGNSSLFTQDNEQWTLKKILRRFIWHDRIHAKAIHRILQKQMSLGLIAAYEDPFRFEISK